VAPLPGESARRDVTALLFIAGLVLLAAGGELLVRGAARLAGRIGVPPLIIGLTVVAFGTSSPELAVSVQAALAGQADIAVGNVVGSNIFNVLFVLGLSALIVPLVVSEQLVRLDVPVMVGISITFMLMAANGVISRPEATLLVLALAAYIGMQVVLSRRSPPSHVEGVEGAGGSLPANVVLIVAGLGLLLLGSRWLIASAVEIATLFGMPQLVIGLTIVAAGTSMPEVATSVVAGIRGQRDIAVGNVVGSNIFNILAVVGITGVVSPAGIPIAAGALSLDIPVMVAVAVLCLPIFITQFSISRGEGLLFLAYYAVYTAYLILDASSHEALEEFGTVIVRVVLPITLATLLAFIWRARRSRN
jgi:cation:H+ antiporter